MSNLSIIVITKNEEQDIRDCLDSVKELSEDIVVVDSGSTDHTVEIAKIYTSKIFHKEWIGFSAQKQYALSMTRNPWILNIDADERVTPALGAEIKELLNKESPDEVEGYQIPFRSYFFGKRLRFGSGMTENHIRLFKKDRAEYGEDPVHEGIRIKGSVGRLKNPIDHFSYRTVDDYLEKCNVYTSLLAQKKFQKGDRFYFYHHLRLPYEFVVRYIFKLGFLDGKVGFTYALLSAFYVWLKYVKLGELQKKEL